MRSFIAASCCVIVGLEILIGVPVAVCLGFICFESGPVQGPYVAEARFDGPAYAPIYADPVYTPGVGPYDPYQPPKARASLCPAPQVSMPCPAPIAPAVQASLPASDPAADQLPPLPIAPSSSIPIERSPAPRNPLAVDSSQFLARVCAEGNCPSANAGCPTAAKVGAPETDLVQSLLDSAALLYQQADRYEADQEYDLADRLRTLARDLRDEAASISRQTPEYDAAPVVDPAPPATAPAPVVKPVQSEEPRTVTVGPPPLG